MHIEQLGRALGAMIRQSVDEDIRHMDVDAHDAPGECHEIVARGEEQRRRRARRQCEAIARAPMRVVRREAIRRLGGQRAFQRAMDRCEARTMARRCPFI